ncbi:Uncharacterized protein PRO82_000667 [Candidatus Protochlamydia amoebophila]|nr:Uncharacterized protein [Candidatus Protochlamydia amoebophila]
MKMSKISLPSTRLLFKLGLGFLAILLLFAKIGYSYGQTNHSISDAILQGSIQIQASKLIDPNSSEKVQPGTPVQLSVIVENKGSQASPKGDIYLCYGFAKPLDKENGSILFQTEKQTFPSIDPGKSVIISFSTPHLLPSILDFVRNDWTLREYQAIAVLNGKEHLIGSLAMTFSAYYYPGMHKEFPTIISVPLP